MHIGEKAYHPLSGIGGTVDADAVWPDGRRLVRIEDHWFFADECQ